MLYVMSYRSRDVNTVRLQLQPARVGKVFDATSREPLLALEARDTRQQRVCNQDAISAAGGWLGARTVPVQYIGLHAPSHNPRRRHRLRRC